MPNIKVLIVEDDPMISFLHKSLIVKHGISSAPKTFLNGKEALDFVLADACENNYYLILLDLNMPVMDGWEFLEELQGSTVATCTKVAIVTSSIDRADREKAEGYDFVNHYLVKPLLDFSPIRKAVDDLKKQNNGQEPE